MSPLFLLYPAFFGIVNAFPLSVGHDTHPSQVTLDLPICEEPSLTPNTHELTPMEDIAMKLPNPLTEVSVYWSGRVDEKSIKPMAGRCASVLGAKTLGMMMCDIGGFVTPSIHLDQPGTVGGKWWDHASELFANYTTGRAYLMLGEKFELNGTFFAVELPALIRNPNVQSVIQVNRDTCEIECYRYCRNPGDCPDRDPCATPIITVTKGTDSEGSLIHA